MSSGRKRKKRNPDMHLQHLKIAGEALPETLAGGAHAQLRVFAFEGDTVQDVQLKSPEDVSTWLGKNDKFWLNVDGRLDGETVKEVGAIFHLHELAVDDIISPVLRAKVDTYGKQLFITLRSACWKESVTRFEQLNIILGENYVVTFQNSTESSALQQVIERLKRNGSRMQSETVDYLMYLIIDAVIDAYFPVVEGLGDELDRLEDNILEKVSRSTPARILELKREILAVRRAIWPSRDVLNTLGRDDMSDFITQRTRTYLRDCYDHANRIIDLIETHREMCADMMDLYLSSVSNRMNEVMKVLTTMTLLFMPPGLIAAIYGMNFDRSSPFNLPELSWRYGYWYCLALMLVSSLLVYYYGRHHGWLREEEE